MPNIKMQRTGAEFHWGRQGHLPAADLERSIYPE